MFSAASRGHFGGPYLILEDSNRTLKKGDFPVLDLTRGQIQQLGPLGARFGAPQITIEKNGLPA